MKPRHLFARTLFTLGCKLEMLGTPTREKEVVRTIQEEDRRYLEERFTQGEPRPNPGMTPRAVPYYREAAIWILSGLAVLTIVIFWLLLFILL